VLQATLVVGREEPFVAWALLAESVEQAVEARLLLVLEQSV